MHRAPRIYGLILALASTASGSTFVINPEGTGDFPTIQEGIDAAAGGDLILLTDGTFTGDGNRDVDFLGKAITVRSESGLPAACIIDCEGSEAEPHRGFQFVSGEPAAAELSDITITHGWATGDLHGGAILCDAESSPLIRGCVFTANRDAALCCLHWSAPTITDCLFLLNTGEHGGGISSVAAFPVISGCEFTENHAASGGGVHGHAATVHISNCTFTGNTAVGWGGGLALLYGCTGTVTDCLFQGNSAAEAGAVNLHFATGFFERCTFANNTAALGGALYTSKMTVADLVNCTFWGNEAIRGAALFCGELVTHLDHTVIAFNLGGAAVGVECEVNLSCCDIYGNEGGDWVGGLEPQYGINGNICEDPLFCDPESGDFTLHSSSPCAPATAPNPECDLIGAWPVGCGPTPVTQTSWGGMKALFGK